uniref:Centrosomal protein 85, like n=1 Tax=Oryzias melastigma TaxID=30732 RepID=A0A3B3BZ22_ORYME
MWGGNQDDSDKTGSPGWGCGPDPAWPGGSGMYGGRRRSAVSDSGDTGIGTLCSDSLEDDSGSGTTPPSLHLSLLPHSIRDDDTVPVVAITPSSSFSPGSGCRTPASPHSAGRWTQSWYSPKARSSQMGAPSCLDLKDPQPIRRWSSFTKLSSGSEKNSTRTSSFQYNADAQGSLDRGLQYGSRKACRSTSMDFYLPLSSISTCSTTLQRSPGASPSSWYQHSSRSLGLDMDRFPSSAHSSPLKQSSLDVKYAPSTEPNMARGGGHGFGLSFSKSAERSLVQKGERTSPIQPAVRTQMWLTEQMEYRPKSEPGSDADELSPWQQGLNQTLMETSLPVHTLVKVKEEVLRQRELEILRQKQQILQLHIRIRENELRAQQLLQNHRGWSDDPLSRNAEESPARTLCKQPTDWSCCHEEVGRKLALAELEVLHLNKFFKQVTQKYTEDMRKLEEKVKTRDRYICSLKKKCQRESEQNREKQQRIETLERYLSELPTVEQVHERAQQQEDLHQKAQDLEKTVSKLQKNLEERHTLMKEKDIVIESQAKREEELIASVISLQSKVQQCFSDGVRLPVQDLKQLEVENSQLLQQRNHSSQVTSSRFCSLTHTGMKSQTNTSFCFHQIFRHQKEEIERLSLLFMAARARLQEKRGVSHQQQSHPSEEEEDSRAPPSRAALQNQKEDLSLCVPSGRGKSEVDQLLKEMSLCLMDLQALCKILAQRAQGKEPNLSLLLGIKCRCPASSSYFYKVLKKLNLQLKARIEDLVSFSFLEVLA